MKIKLVIAVSAVLAAAAALADQERGTCSTATVAIATGHIRRQVDGGWTVGACGTVRNVDGGSVPNDSACVDCGEIGALGNLAQLDGGCYAQLVQTLCP